MSWFVATDFFHRGGRKVAGPYPTQDEAIAARTELERVEGHSRYFVDEEPEPSADVI